MNFPTDFLDTLRARVSLYEIVGRRVKWNRAKSNPSRQDWWACCPFHHEKTPSFHVEAAKGFYYCFGCQAKGDAVRFVMETENLPFTEAVARLAREVGLELPARNERNDAESDERKTLLAAVATAAAWFEAELKSSSGKDARAWLVRRNVAPETAEVFGLGFAPPGRDGLKKALQAKGVSEAAAIKAGLLVKPDDGGASYDRFRNRIMFPIKDTRDAVIAFGARALDPEARAKYLNSPETPLFQKRITLYALDKARAAARSSGLIVVEGYMDVLALYGVGVKHAVASLGTALTEDHIRQLWRLAPEPVFCLDGDAAGQRAATRIVERLLPEIKPGHAARFAFLPAGKDPDDLIQEGGRKAIDDALSAALPLAEALYAQEISEAAISTPEQKAALMKRVNELTGRINDSDVRHYYRQMLRVRLNRHFWKDEVAAGKRAAGLQASTPPPGSGQSAHERLLLGTLIAYPALFAARRDAVEKTPFASEAYGALRDELLRILDSVETPTSETFYEEAGDGFQRLLDIVHGREGAESYHRLFPLARLSGAEDFVARCLDHFLRVQNYRALIGEYRASVAACAHEINEAHYARLTALHKMVEVEQQKLKDEAQQLSDEALNAISAATPNDAHPTDWSALFTLPPAEIPIDTPTDTPKNTSANEAV